MHKPYPNLIRNSAAGLVILMTSVASPCHAEEAAEEIPEYDFELIIFEDVTGRYANSEQWTHGTEHVAAEDSLQGYDTAPARSTGKVSDREIMEDSKVVNILDIDGIGLQAYADKLKASNRYNVLVHKAWRQSGLDADEAFEIPIDSSTASGAAAAMPDFGLGANRSEQNVIHGTVKVVLGRYLHFYTDLVYQQPRDDIAPVAYAASPWKDYPIKSHRRMRSKELHYLDHPMVGMLIMALPVEAPEEAEAGSEG